MNNRLDNITIETLELKAVIAKLKGFLMTSQSAITVGANLIEPFENIDEVKSAYKELAEVITLRASDVQIDLSGFYGFSHLFEKILPQNSYLIGEDFVEVKSSLFTISELNKIVNSEEIFSELPIVNSKLNTLNDNSELALLLSESIDDKGTILDGASYDLRLVREKITELKSKVGSLIDSIMKEKSFEGVLQDDIVSIREDRFVFAVKSERHKDLPGIIHGRSQTLQTAFIEPMELVGVNNELTILKKEEKEEEIKVLKSLTEQFKESKVFLLSDEEIISALDIVLAKAKFLDYTGGVIPQVSNDNAVKLINARHPVLLLNELSGKSAKVIPVDIELKSSVQTLVLSGANAGGKTVALKSLGLITLMAWFAMPLPIDEGSNVRLFKNIYTDIGDTQDITMELSTYTGHLTRVNDILNKADKDSLILLDEIGTGTDPSEGGAMALAIIEEFISNGATLAVTTHLNILKAQAQRDDRFENATVVFDDKTMTPKYVIRYGVPGLSMGITVAEKLGFNEKIITRARGVLKGDESFFVETLENLKNELNEVEALKESLKELEVKRDSAVKKLRDEKNELVKKLKKNYEDKLFKAEKEINDIVKTVKGAQKEADFAKLNEEKNKLNKLKAEFKKETKSNYVPSKNDTVTIGKSPKELTVLKVDKKEKTVELKSGIMKMTVKWEDLEEVKKSKGPKKQAVRGQGQGVATYNTASRSTSSLELNVIGKRVEEALNEVEPFVDSAHVNGLETVDIIHGRGTGALRKAIHEYLETSTVVKSFRLKTDTYGGEGVTEVKLK